MDVPRAKDGWRGFQFVKVCNSGSVAGKGGCLASAVQGPGPNDWGCTQDKVTGLMWELKATDGGLHDRSRTFNDRLDDPSSADVQVAAVNAAGLCGRQDWRRPSGDELLSLADFHEQVQAGYYPGMEVKWFPDHETPGDYWTGTPYADPDAVPPVRGATWFVRFNSLNSGLMDTVNHDNRLRLRLVSGSAPVQVDRFVANGAEVLDTAHGLIWQRCALGQTWTGLTCEGLPQAFNHAAALQAALSAAAGGVPWRLPNIKELVSLVQRERFNPAIDPSFPGADLGTTRSFYWSSTHLPVYSSAHVVRFEIGHAQAYPRSDIFSVRLVRTAP